MGRHSPSALLLGFSNFSKTWVGSGGLQWTGVDSGQGSEAFEITAKYRQDERLRQLEKPLSTDFKSLLPLEG
jgi:hypothetical protein